MIGAAEVDDLGVDTPEGIIVGEVSYKGHRYPAEIIAPVRPSPVADHPQLPAVGIAAGLRLRHVGRPVEGNAQWSTAHTGADELDSRYDSRSVPARIQRQVRQQRADIDALYELVERVDQKVDALDIKLDRRFDESVASSPRFYVSSAVDSRTSGFHVTQGSVLRNPRPARGYRPDLVGRLPRPGSRRTVPVPSHCRQSSTLIPMQSSAGQSAVALRGTHMVASRS